uniref:Uncharacterized protein n=1 Tax=Steinernema glaseri TaxID=37863 RepID=A0A1I7ZVR8_9BILA
MAILLSAAPLGRALLAVQRLRTLLLPPDAPVVAGLFLRVPMSTVADVRQELKEPVKSNDSSSTVVWVLLIGINVVTAVLSYGNLTWLDNKYSKQIRGVMGLLLLLSAFLLFSQVKQPEPAVEDEKEE